MVLRRFLATSTCVAVALLAAACGGSAGTATPLAAASSSTSSPDASTSPQASVDDGSVAGLAGGKTHTVRGSEITVTLPKGWTALPMDPKKFAKALGLVTASNPQAAGLFEGQDPEELAKKFAFYGVKTSSGGVTSINVVDIGDTGGASSKEVIAQVEQAMDSIGATDVTTGTKTLPIGDVVFATYTLAVGKQTIHGVQYYLTDRAHSLTITFSTPDLDANQAAFDAIAQGMRTSS